MFSIKPNRQTTAQQTNKQTKNLPLKIILKTYRIVWQIVLLNELL